MIPKIIHYCWFGSKDYPELVKKCIKTWKKKLPDYEFKLWNEESFDINQNNWCRQAYGARKFAFVADYARLVVLKQFGGIYLDTDIKLEKSFNDLLDQEAFMGFEDGNVLSAGVIGVHPNNSFLDELLGYYQQDFDEDRIIGKNVANVKVITEKMMEYGLVTDNSEQYIRGFHVYPKTYFNPLDFFGNWDRTKKTYCVHLYMGSWLPKEQKKLLDRRKTITFKITKRIYLLMKNNIFIKRFRKVLRKYDII